MEEGGGGGEGGGAAHQNFTLTEIIFRSSEDLTLPQSSLGTFRVLLKWKVQDIYMREGPKRKEE